MPISLDGLVLCHCKSGADEAGQRAPFNAVGERESRHHLHAGCRLGRLRHPPSLSRKTGQPPVLTSPNPLSTLPQRFACARLSQSCLPESCSDFSATFTTIAFDDSSLRWLGDQHLIADLEGPSFISRTVTHRRVDRRYSSHKTHSACSAGCWVARHRGATFGILRNRIGSALSPSSFTASRKGLYRGDADK